MSAGPYSIGSIHCPGLSKLAEEAGEVVQVVGKIMGAGGMVQHWDGSDLRERLMEEMADVMAACQFVIEANGLHDARIHERVQKKFDLFRKWHREQLHGPDPYEGRRAANAIYVPGRRQFVRAEPEAPGTRHEWCALCEQHVSMHYTDGRPTYFCDLVNP